MTNADRQIRLEFVIEILRRIYCDMGQESSSSANTEKILELHELIDRLQTYSSTFSEVKQQTNVPLPRSIIKLSLANDVVFTSEAAQMLDMSPQVVLGLVYRKKLLPIRSTSGAHLFYRKDIEDLKRTEVSSQEKANL